jgi:hypothetical protein
MSGNGPCRPGTVALARKLRKTDLFCGIRSFRSRKAAPWRKTGKAGPSPALARTRTTCGRCTTKCLPVASVELDRYAGPMRWRHRIAFSHKHAHVRAMRRGHRIAFRDDREAGLVQWGHWIALSHELTARPVRWRHRVAFGDRARRREHGVTYRDVDRPNNREYDQ